MNFLTSPRSSQDSINRHLTQYGRSLGSKPFNCLKYTAGLSSTYENQRLNEEVIRQQIFCLCSLWRISGNALPANWISYDYQRTLSVYNSQMHRISTRHLSRWKHLKRPKFRFRDTGCFHARVEVNMILASYVRFQRLREQRIGTNATT